MACAFARRRIEDVCEYPSPNFILCSADTCSVFKCRQGRKKKVDADLNTEASIVQETAAETPAQMPLPVIWPDLQKTAPELQAGRAVYEEWCATCHTPNGFMPGTIALEAKYQGDLPAALIYRKDFTPETVAFFVRNGVSLMAPFRKTEITDDQLSDLGEFLSAPLSLRGVDVVALEGANAKAASATNIETNMPSGDEK